MNIEQEIRAQIEKNKGLKLAVGEINNHLSILEGLLRNERDDVQKQVDEAYQRGLEDAWEAARKIVRMPEGDLLNIFTECYSAVCTALQVLLKYDASEAIEKLKAYEEKQKADGEIKVGDEVIYNGTTKCLVVRPETDERYAVLIDGNGYHYSADHRECKKTGRHFDIQSILEEMRT